MGRKRKTDVILNPETFSDRNCGQSSPVPCKVAIEHRNTSINVPGTYPGRTGRSLDDILREYLNLLNSGVGTGTYWGRLNAEAPNACFAMRRHIEDKSTGSFVGLSEASVDGCCAFPVVPPANISCFHSQADYVHLYSIPLRCGDSDETSNIVICDCSEMETARDFLDGLRADYCTAQGLS